MRRKKTQIANEESDPELLEHIRGLGLESVKAYRDWCVQHGFGRRLTKHWKLRCQERYHARQDLAEQRLKQKKHEQRNPEDVLRDVCLGKLTEDDVTQPHLQRLCEALRPVGRKKHERQTDRGVLSQMLTHLHKCRAAFFDSSPVIADFGNNPGNTYPEALALIAAHSHAWQQQLVDWKPRSHNARRQFSSLLRHLFVQYEMPAFFDSVWLAGRSKEAAEQRKWYRHVGRGQNLRNCRLPVPMTKKMVHHFMRAPGDVNVRQALRWGQVLGLGGDERLARAILASRLTEQFQHNEFWSSVIRWFVAHPLLDRVHVAPIVDYLHHQRFVPTHVFVNPGHREELPALQPNLSMKDRTPAVLLRKVNEWHHSLANDNRHQVRQWSSRGIQGFEFLEGSRQNDNLKCWTIRELLSSKALVTEGRQLKHCVATYALSCAQGHSSIWTMEVDSFAGLQKVLTIEVRNREQLICQVRGKANRMPTDKERRVIRLWAEKSGLRTACYL